MAGKDPLVELLEASTPYVDAVARSIAGTLALSAVDFGLGTGAADAVKHQLEQTAKLTSGLLWPGRN